MTQIPRKVLAAGVPAELAEAFSALCKSKGTSINAELIRMIRLARESQLRDEAVKNGKVAAQSPDMWHIATEMCAKYHALGIHDDSQCYVHKSASLVCQNIGRGIEAAK